MEYRKTDAESIKKHGYTDEEVESIKFYNSILLDKYPYFFKYRYKDCKKKYDVYIDSNEVTCRSRFRMSLSSLMSLSKKTPEQSEFIDNYYRYMPVNMSNSPMNMLCKYIESVNFEIAKKIKEDKSIDIVPILKYEDKYTKEEYKLVADELDKYLLKHRDVENKNIDVVSANNDEYVLVSDYLDEATKIINLVPKVGVAINCAIDYFYIKNPSKNKDILWNMFGSKIISNMRERINKVYVPTPDSNGDIIYLGEKYSRQEVEF